MKLKYKYIYLLVIVINILIAIHLPIGNDEAYYIAFAKHLQLSYVDAPPFVAYLNLIQAKLGLLQPIFARSLVIVLHLISTLFLLLIVKNNCPDDENLSKKLLLTFLLAYIVPVFGIYAVFILPDCGLILALSIMLWTTDRVYRTKALSLLNCLILGIGLGIGLLSKYHILPLGFGMLFGLYIDLYYITRKNVIPNLAKLLFVVAIALLIGLPVFIWNYNNHFASFVFQLQNGFRSDHWEITSLFAFLLGAVLYLTPWFSYMFLKYGIFKKVKLYLIIPFFALLLILILSSLRKNILPHWISPVFWLLIPYTVLNIKNSKRLLTMCKYTAILWYAVTLILIFPGGLLYNMEKISERLNLDITGMADMLLWEKLPSFLPDNPQVKKALINLNELDNSKCNVKSPLIGTVFWFFAAQLEYHEIFNGKYKVLNLDGHSSSFYTWRDNLVDYANCRIMVIGLKQSNYNALQQILDIKNYYVIDGVDSFKTLQLFIIVGQLKNSEVLAKAQEELLTNPRY